MIQLVGERDGRAGTAYLLFSEYFFNAVNDIHKVGIGLPLGLLVGDGVVKHAGADTAHIVVAPEDVVVDTPFTPFPKLLIVGEFGEGDGDISHLRVELHHRQRGGDTEYLGVGEAFAGKFEGLALDSLGQPLMAIFRVDDQTGGGHEVAMTPALDIAEPDEAVAVEGHYSFATLHFRSYIVGGATGNACAALEG